MLIADSVQKMQKLHNLIEICLKPDTHVKISVQCFRDLPTAVSCKALSKQSIYIEVLCRPEGPYTKQLLVELK